MSREELAARVAAWIARHDERNGPPAFDANHMGKLERGVVRQPNALIRAALCAILDASEEDLGFVSPPALERVTAAANGLHTDRAALDAVASVLASVRRLEDVTSAAAVLPAVERQAALVTRLPENSRGDVRPAAVGLLSEIEQYLGWLAIPLQRWDDSRRHLDRASVLGLEADGPERLATALSFAAYRDLRRGALHSADALNDAAGRDSRVHIGLRAYLAFQRAEVLARDGSRAESLRLLAEADRLVGQLPDNPEELPTFGYWYVPSFFHGQRAFVLAALGDIPAARRMGRRSD